MCVGVSRCPGSFAKQLDPRPMSAKDYAYNISSSLVTQPPKRAFKGAGPRD